jgi:hypothetical protein
MAFCKWIILLWINLDRFFGTFTYVWTVVRFNSEDTNSEKKMKLSEDFFRGHHLNVNIFWSVALRSTCLRGCQTANFQTKNPNLGKFWRVLQWRMLVYVMAIWSISPQFGRSCGHSIYFTVIWYVFSRFGILYQEKSGNPAYPYGQLRPLCMYY